MVVGLAAIGWPTLVSAQGENPEIEGAWRAQTYILASGTSHSLRGHIMFTGGDWNVLFFVMDGEEPLRMSAEGGTYTLHGSDLVFTHFYLAQKGDAVEGLPASPFEMIARDNEGPEEAATVSVVGSKLTLFFPSGNRMTFVKTQDDR